MEPRSKNAAVGVGVAAPASNDDDVDLFGSEDEEEDAGKRDAEKQKNYRDGRPSLGRQQAGPHWVRYQEAAADGCC